MPGTLYVVATPIGNLQDLSPRAISILSQCDLVAAEDTRHSGRLLAHAGISAKLVAFHEHSSERVMTNLVERLLGGESIALISDAGTPLISDPGFALVRACRDQQLAVVPIPGSCAAVAALSVSGLATDRFCFEGYAPAKPVARRKFYQSVARNQQTLVLYESTHRIVESLADLCQVLGGSRPAFLAREMTKMHEQYQHGSLDELLALVESGAIPQRGEFVLVVAGSPAPSEDSNQQAARRLIEVLLAELSASQSARLAAAATGLSKKGCYQIALTISQQQQNSKN